MHEAECVLRIAVDILHSKVSTEPQIRLQGRLGVL